jgi:hypothetical protein
MKVTVFCFCTYLLFALSCWAQEQHFEGTWQTSVRGSALLAHAKPVRYVIHLSKTNGIITGTMDTPDHFEFADELDSLVFDNPHLKFRAGPAFFEGTLSADSQSIAGTWSLGAEKQNVTWQHATSTHENRMETVALTLRSLMHLPAEEWKCTRPPI